MSDSHRDSGSGNRTGLDPDSHRDFGPGIRTDSDPGSRKGTGLEDSRMGIGFADNRTGSVPDNHSDTARWDNRRDFAAVRRSAELSAAYGAANVRSATRDRN